MSGTGLPKRGYGESKSVDPSLIRSRANVSAPTLRQPTTIGAPSPPQLASRPFIYQFVKLPKWFDLHSRIQFEIIMFRAKTDPRDIEDEGIPIFYNEKHGEKLQTKKYILKGMSLAYNLDSAVEGDERENERMVVPRVQPFALTEQFVTRYMLSWEPTPQVFARMAGQDEHSRPAHQTLSQFDLALMINEIREEFRRRNETRRDEGRPQWYGFILRLREAIPERTKQYNFSQVVFGGEGYRLLNEELNDNSLLWLASKTVQSCQGEQGRFRWQKLLRHNLSCCSNFWVNHFPTVLGLPAALLASVKAYIGVKKFFETYAYFPDSLGTAIGLIGSFAPVVFYFASNKRILRDIALRLTSNKDFGEFLIRFATKHNIQFPKPDKGLMQYLFNGYFGIFYAAGNAGMVMASDFFTDPLQESIFLTGIIITNLCVGTDKADKFTSDFITAVKQQFGKRNPALASEFERLTTALESLETAYNEHYHTALAYDTPKAQIERNIKEHRKYLANSFEADKDGSISNAIRRVSYEIRVIEQATYQIQYTNTFLRLSAQNQTSATAATAPLVIPEQDAANKPFFFQSRFHGDNGDCRKTLERLGWGMSLFISFSAVLSNIFGVDHVLTTTKVGSLLHLNDPRSAGIMAFISSVSAIGLNKGATDKDIDYLLIKSGHSKLTAQFPNQGSRIDRAQSSLNKILRFCGMLLGMLKNPLFWGYFLAAIQATCGFWYTANATILSDSSFQVGLKYFAAVMTFYLMTRTKGEKCVELFVSTRNIASRLCCCFNRSHSFKPIVKNKFFTAWQNKEIQHLINGITSLVDEINRRLHPYDVVNEGATDLWACVHKVREKLGMNTPIDIELQQALGVYPYLIRDDDETLSFSKRLETALNQITKRLTHNNNYSEVRGKLIETLDREMQALSICSQMLDKGKDILSEGLLQHVRINPETHQVMRPASLIRPEHREIISEIAETPVPFERTTPFGDDARALRVQQIKGAGHVSFEGAEAL